MSKDVQHDFVNDLLYRYLQDVKHRQKAGEFGRATAAVLLRKCTKLDDMEIMIEDLQAKSNDLLSNAEKMSLKLAEESKQKEIEANIKRLSHKKLEYKAEKTFKRQNSWKGREIGMFEGFELEDYQKKMAGAERATSKQIKRDAVNRATQRKAHPGMASALGSSGFSRPDGEDDEDEHGKVSSKNLDH